MGFSSFWFLDFQKLAFWLQVNPGETLPPPETLKKAGAAEQMRDIKDLCKKSRSRPGADPERSRLETLRTLEELFGWYRMIREPFLGTLMSLERRSPWDCPLQSCKKLTGTSYIFRAPVYLYHYRGKLGPLIRLW